MHGSGGSMRVDIIPQVEKCGNINNFNLGFQE
jgi:hypothetical protein